MKNTVAILKTKKFDGITTKKFTKIMKKNKKINISKIQKRN